ncbi:MULTISPECIES: hypothetical protein [unclassified Motilimonas]|uniref:hypothetical protein n=1 Tax=Motilimonas TaxID=1914248 RepID=UPI001E29C95A|nr:MULTISPECIES: hypothetical protein [unclassified Motilimonas]MCE0557706.1 hypothetical protein [Motilimonas sp. E26]MDO6525986.1 hypothetical protein [Motilimonas sp. 1_MG-2023]
MKLNAYNQPGLAYGLPDKNKVAEEVKEPNKPTTLPDAAENEDSNGTPATQETILEGIQRVKQSMNDIRYSTEIAAGDKEQQLKPLQNELDELVSAMQFAIKDFASNKTNELFGFDSSGSERKVGTLFDFMA